MTPVEAQLVIDAVTDETQRIAAIGVLGRAGVVTPAYQSWYVVQTPLRQSAEWSRGGFLFLQAQRVGVGAAASGATIWGQVAAAVGAAAGAPLRWLMWALGGALVVVIVLGLVLRR